MTTIPDTRVDTQRVVVAGSFAGEAELFALLEHDTSGFEVVAWTPDVKDAALYLSDGAVSAVFVGVGKDGMPKTWSLARDVATIRRHDRVPVMLLVDELDAETVDTALAAGVDDVLVLPQSVEQLAFAIRKARQNGRGTRQSDDAKQGRVVTVFSPKGGTGKTVLSTNIASVLAARSEQKVLLIDLDLQFGDAAIMLGVDPRLTFHDLVAAPGVLDGEKLEGYVTKHKSGLHILAAPLRPEEAELVTEAKVSEVLEVAREAYDVVVVDTSPFFYGPMLALLEPTDQLFMLCGLDVPTLKNVKLSLQTLEQLGFPMSRVELVLNRVTPKVGLSTEDVATTLGLPVRFEIPNDPVVAPAVNRGAAAALLEPDSEFATALASLAAAADPVGAPVAATLATTSKRRWFTPARRLLEGRSA
ncbi:MAG: AAA family ATPase [Gaiellales bacterium]